MSELLDQLPGIAFGLGDKLINFGEVIGNGRLFLEPVMSAICFT